jgi:hypothetical protein
VTAGLAWRAAADVLDSTGKFIVALQNDFRKLFLQCKILWTLRQFAWKTRIPMLD